MRKISKILIPFDTMNSYYSLKDTQFSVRFDGETLKILDKYCEEHKIKKAEAVRNGINLLLCQKKIRDSSLTKV